MNADRAVQLCLQQNFYYFLLELLYTGKAGRFLPRLRPTQRGVQCGHRHAATARRR